MVRKSGVIESTVAPPQGASQEGPPSNQSKVMEGNIKSLGVDVVAKELAARDQTIQALEAKLLQTQLRLQQKSIQEAVAVRELILLKKRSQEAFAYRTAVWPAGTSIPVCWENPRPEDEQARQWVKAAIERTWQRESGLVFTGWGPAKFDSVGIRITIADDVNQAPHCKQLGQYLNGTKSGMVLNFSFQKWCPQCPVGRSLKTAIENVAIHEFGHAIGFAHEQNRSDAPGWCQNESQGPDGDYPVTVYDPFSIMNYCNPRWNNDGRLSALDIEAIQTLYGRPKR